MRESVNSETGRESARCVVGHNPVDDHPLDIAPKKMMGVSNVRSMRDNSESGLEDPDSSCVESA